jgi:hypothetical protein
MEPYDISEEIANRLVQMKLHKDAIAQKRERGGLSTCQIHPSFSRAYYLTCNECLNEEEGYEDMLEFFNAKQGKIEEGLMEIAIDDDQQNLFYSNFKLAEYLAHDLEDSLANEIEEHRDEILQELHDMRHKSKIETTRTKIEGTLEDLFYFRSSAGETIYYMGKRPEKTVRQAIEEAFQFVYSLSLQADKIQEDNDIDDETLLQLVIENQWKL